MSSTDNYSALSESKSKDDHRLKVLSEDGDGDGAQNYGAFSIETPPNDVVDVHGGNRKCGGRTRAWSKKKKVIVSLISAALLSFVAFVVAVIVELLLVQPQLNIAPSSLSMADSVHLQADASFPNPPRLSNVHISSTACKLYDSTGAYFATVSLENAKLASKFSLNARMDSVDISGFSRMMDQVLAARNAPKSDQSAIKAVCAASVTVSDAVFGASYSKDLSVTTSVRMQELWAAATDGTPVSGIDNFDWVDVQIPAGMRVEMAPFMYLANLQTPASDSTDVDSSNIERNFKDSRESESTSSESPLGCYALRSNSFSYTANLNDFRTAARELYTQWTNHLEYRREDCKDVCRNTNIATSQIGNDGVAVLSVCSPSNTFISNFLGDHHFSAQFATGSNLHLELTDTIEQHSSLGTLPSSYVSTYTAAHASLTTGSSTLGRVSVAPPEFVQALGVDATLIATYSYNVVSPQVATVLASVVLSAADPSSSGFSLTANADFNYLINIVSANQWAVNVSADFASNYSPSSGSSSTHYGGAVLAAGVLDSNAQSLKLSAALSFDANGQSFPFPTQYSADIFGQYSNVNSIIRVDTNGDVAWSGTQQTIFSGNFILNQNTQFGTLIFSEHPGGSASARTALFASSFYTLSTSPLVRFSLQNAVGTLTTNYSPRSIQEVSASLVAPLSVSGDWPFLLNLTIIERAPSDPAFRTRVLVDEAISLQVALQAASTITFSNNGTIVANYQPITQYRARFSVNTQKSVVQLAFYEGGPNDFPAVPTATPRTAYFLTSPLSYAFSSTSSPAINLSFTVNGAAQLIFSNAVQSVHTVSWTLTLQKDALLMYNFYFFISAVERAGTDPATACRFCLHQTGKASIASSSNVFVNSASSISSSGDLTFQYNFLTAWSVTGVVDGKQQLAIVSFNEGGQNDYPYVPTAKPRTQFVTKPDLTYQYSSQPGVLTISATGAGQLTYSYSQVSQDSVTLAFSYVSSANTAVQLDFTFSDHFATDPSTVYRVLIDEHTSYNSAAADENDPDVSNVGITSRGTLIANYNVLSSYTLQFALNTQQSKVQTLAFYEGGVNDYPYVPSGTARTAYVVTSPIIYSWSYTPSPLALNLNVNGAGQLTFSYAVQSVHSLSLTLNLGAQNSVATLYFFVSISERSGSDSVGSCRVCISDTTTATLPYSSDAYTQGSASLSSAGSMAINYNFLSAFQLNAAANGAQQIITLSFSEGGINDYPTVPSAPARTAYAFTPNVVYNLNTFTGGATFTITGSGQLTVNRNVLSVHSLQATFGYTNSPSGKLTIQLTEQAATDAPTVFRVQVDDSISFAWASPAAAASSSGTIIANYQYLTSYIFDAAADTKQQVVSFSFYEGGQNDFPAQPGQPPRTAYVLAPTQYTYSYSNSPLSLLIGASPAGQLTYGGALQSVHSATVSLSLQQDSQSIVHVQLTTNLAERSGSDKPGTCRECISHTSTASIPVSSSAFNFGITTLSSTGNVLIQYNFLSGFSLLALVDGSQNTVQVAFAEGGANDGPTQPFQPPRTALNLNGTFNYSTSPIIISSDGSGNLTYSRAVQSIFQYSFLFDNADQVVRVSVTANSPSDPAIQHSLRTSLAALAPKEPLTVRVSLATTRDSYPIAYAETAVQMSCDAGSLAVHSNVQNIGSCGSGNWQSTIPNVLCHVNSERHTAAVSAVCEVTTMMALGNEIA